MLDNLVHTIAVNRDQWLCYDQTNRLSNVKANGDCSTGSTILGLGYDPQGNLANWNGVEYAFDYGNRLRQVEGLEAYRYDGHGRRVLATSLQGLGNLLSMYGQSGQMLYQQDSRSGQWRDFVYLGGSLVAERAKAFSTGAATVTYQHTDALGTPVAKTNASRVVVQRSEYEPYGKLLNRPLENGPGYTGHVTDAATQLTYMQQRYYDPRVGRFWSVDPVTVDSDGGNFNRYWYANNNPYRFTDPDGRKPRRGDMDLCDTPGLCGSSAGNAILASSRGEARASTEGEVFVSRAKGYIDSQAELGPGGKKTSHVFSDDVIEAVGHALDGNFGPAAKNMAMALVFRKLEVISSLRGAAIDEIEALIPKNWIRSVTRNDDGLRFANPERAGEQVRIMFGNSRSPELIKHGPYIRISRDGVISDPIPLSGNPAL